MSFCGSANSHVTRRAPSYHFFVGSVVNEGPYCLGTSGQREEEDADLEN